MAGRRAGAGLALAAIALSASGCSIGGSTTTVTTTVTRTVTTTRTVTQNSVSQCTGSQLSGTFAVVVGSAGAGQISYALKLTNTSSSSCSFSGLSTVQLLSASRSALPTTTVDGSLIVDGEISPGGSVVADARFSPSVPGPGDAQTGPCQPKAYTLVVTLTGGGTVDTPIKPPTSVCKRGTLNFGQFGVG